MQQWVLLANVAKINPSNSLTPTFWAGSQAAAVPGHKAGRRWAAASASGQEATRSSACLRSTVTLRAIKLGIESPVKADSRFVYLRSGMWRVGHIDLRAFLTDI